MIQFVIINEIKVVKFKVVGVFTEKVIYNNEN